MSKSASATAPKIPGQLPHKSAWLRGPPQNSSATSSPRSQSPAPGNATSPTASTSHSRRPSALGSGVSFKDGVAGARSPVATSKPGGSSVTFGSIDDASATISSSPAPAPVIKTEGVKSFGSVPATATSSSGVNGSKTVQASSLAASKSTSGPSSSAPAKPSKVDVKKLFQTPSSGSAPPTSQPPSDISSPSTRPSPLPSHAIPNQQLHGPPSALHPQTPQYPSYSTFVPGLRPQQNGPNGTGPPRSPVYSRQVPNGAPSNSNVNGRPPPTPATPGVSPSPMSAAIPPSPRIGPPHGAHTGQPPMAPNQPMQMWSPYYVPTQYPGMPPDPYAYYQWQHPGVPPPTPQGPPGQPHPGMPMSPRNLPSNLHAPGTPTLAPAVPAPGHPPHAAPSPHMHTSSLSNVSTPPATPSSSTAPGLPSRMDRNASPFVPGGSNRKTVVIKRENGDELSVEDLKRHSSNFHPAPPVIPSSPAQRRTPIRMETEEAKAKRLAEEQEQERKKKEAEERVKREAEEKERKKREEAEEKERQEKERLRKEEEEREKERLRKEEEEKEKERERERERLRKEAEEKEKERLRLEEEKERLRLEEEAKEKARLEEEERVRREAEEVERARKEAEEKEKAALAVPETVPEVSNETEEGELEEEQPPAATDEAAKDESKPTEKSLRIDTTVSNPEVRKRPGPLDLSGTKQPIVAPLPSALATARIIDNLDSVQYPEGIKSPKVELNLNAKPAKYRYDRDFLLQFMDFCKEKPDSLPPLDLLGIESSEQNYAMARGGSGRRQASVSMGPPSSTPSRQASIGLGISTFGKPGAPGFTMGQFSTPGGKMSSEERFAMSNRSASMSGGPAGLPFGRPAPLARSASQGGPGAPMGSHRTRSKRGEKRGDANKGGHASSAAAQAAQAAAAGFEPIAPLELSANRWQAGSLGKKVTQTADPNSPEVVDRKVKGLLNKLTMEKFDSISDQIIAWANKSEAEKDGRTLIQVIRLVFEKATDEATWSEMYARLCRKMMEQISPKVQDDGIRNNEGKPITGGHLFRKYLLNRCQEDFERGWVAKENAQAAAAAKASEDEAAKAAAEASKDGESALYSDEYYIAQKAKRQGLGLIKFIGELFKLQMLTERIMHECVKKLLGNVDNPEEEEIESLCKLLTTVGQLLDTPKARAHMDVYFSRMKELTKSQNVTSRMQFMLQDIIELRERKWIPRNQVAAPTTIAAVHEAAAKEKAAAAELASQRNLSMSRGGSRRGADRGDHTQIGPDGWAVAGTAPRPPPKAGDLSGFGKITKNAPMSFGPTSVWASKKESKSSSRESTISRTGSVNMFSMLSQNPEMAAEAVAAKSSRPPSRKPSVDLGPGGIPAEPAQRRKLNLLPRSVPKEEARPEDSVPPSAANSDDESAEAPAAGMSADEAKKKVQEDSKEFFAVRNLEEAEVYFTKLPVEHRHLLIDKLITVAIDGKERDAQLVGDLFALAASKNLCSPATFEEGFNPTAELLDDYAIDIPKAFPLFATMMKGANLNEEARERLASKLMDSTQLLRLFS